MYRQLAKPTIKVLLKLKCTPLRTSLLSLVSGLVAALYISTGELLIGIVLLQFSLVLDCCDGALARILNRPSSVGGFIDNIFDRVVDSAVIYGLCYYSAEWLLGFIACFCMFMSHYTWDYLNKDEQHNIARENNIKVPKALNFGRFNQLLFISIFCFIDIHYTLMFLSLITFIYTVVRTCIYLRLKVVPRCS